jgi:hypothetical protein
MWTFSKAARLALAATIAGFVTTTVATSQAQAQAVEYVKVCSLYGAGFLYIPGTDTCTNANQIVNNEFTTARLNTLSATGTAMAASLVAPWLPSGTNYAISSHWAGFDGENALGTSGLMRISGNFVFSAGFAVGLDRGSLTSLNDRTQTAFGTSVPQQSWSDLRGLSRVGFMYAW